MNVPDLLNSNLVATGVTGFILLASLLYKIVRTVKRDIRDDRSTETFDNYRDSLMTRLKDMETRNDTIASERNQARELNARYEFEITTLNESLNRMKLDNAILKSQVNFLLTKTELTSADMETFYRIVLDGDKINDDKS